MVRKSKKKSKVGGNVDPRTLYSTTSVASSRKKQEEKDEQDTSSLPASPDPSQLLKSDQQGDTPPANSTADKQSANISEFNTPKGYADSGTTTMIAEITGMTKGLRLKEDTQNSNNSGNRNNSKATGNTGLTKYTEWQVYEKNLDDPEYRAAIAEVHRLAKHRTDGLKRLEKTQIERHNSMSNLVDISLNLEDENRLVQMIQQSESSKSALANLQKDESTITNNMKVTKVSLSLGKSLKSMLTDLDVNFEMMLGYGISEENVRIAIASAKPKTLLNLLEWACLYLSTDALPNEFWCNRLIENFDDKKAHMTKDKSQTDNPSEKEIIPKQEPVMDIIRPVKKKVDKGKERPDISSEVKKRIIEQYGNLRDPLLNSDPDEKKPINKFHENVNPESLLGKFFSSIAKTTNSSKSRKSSIDDPNDLYPDLVIDLRRINLLEKSLLKENKGNRFRTNLNTLKDLAKKINLQIKGLEQDILFDKGMGDSKADKLWKSKEGVYSYNIHKIVEEEKNLFELCEELNSEENDAGGNGADKQGNWSKLDGKESNDEAGKKSNGSKGESGNLDDYEGDLFGAMLDSDNEDEKDKKGQKETEAGGADPANKLPEAEIIDLDVEKSWKGPLPKDLLGELARKVDSGVRTVFIKDKQHSGSGFASTLKMTWSKQSSLNNAKLLGETAAASIDKLTMSWVMPMMVACKDQKSADQLVAMIALYDLFKERNIASRLPHQYKEVWEKWQRRDSGEDKEAEILSDRIDFLKSLVRHPDSTSPPTTPTLKYISDPLDMALGSLSSEEFEKWSRINMSRRSKKWTWQRFMQRTKDNSKEMEAIDSIKKSLPITAARDEIISTLESSQVIIVKGDTGCGKSTQVPQFLVEHLLKSKCYNGTEVICTQPRRISVTSISSRISQEMRDPNSEVGGTDSLVGYQIRMESQKSWANMLLFCTTGILLRRLESDPMLTSVSHIVVDEVQERTIESDFLLTVLRDLLPKRPDLKLVVMSATIDLTLFSDYFSGCPIVSVSGRTFPVASFYLEDVIENTMYSLGSDSKYVDKKALETTAVRGSLTISGRGGNQERVNYTYDHTTSGIKDGIIDDENSPYVDYSVRTRTALARMDKSVVNLDLIHHLIRKIVLPRSDQEFENDMSTLIAEPSDRSMNDWIAKRRVEYEQMKQCIPSEGAILVFLPGMLEIRTLYGMLQGDPDLIAPLDPKNKESDQRTIVIPLHSTLMNTPTKGRQDKDRAPDAGTSAFAIPPHGVRKIVLSTNIAETGITIPDITVVIDSGKSNQVNWDHQLRQTKLQTRWVSKANCKQRKGRAGRVREGLCLCLYTSHQYNKMSAFETPELLRMPLQELCLKLKVYGYPNILDFLMKTPQPPQLDSVIHSIRSLIEVGALRRDESLTILGRYMSMIPVDILISKMLIFGAILKCLDPILTIAAALSLNKSIMVSPFEEPDKSNAKAAHSVYYSQSLESFVNKSEIDRHSVHYRQATQGSDFMAMYLAYLDWKEEASKPDINRRQIISFCKKRWLDISMLEMIEDLKEEYLRLLADIGFVAFSELLTKEQRDKGKKLSPHQVNKVLRPFQSKRSHGFRSGFVRVPPSINEYATNTAVIHAAIVAGLGNVLVPSQEKIGSFVQHQVKYDMDSAQSMTNTDSKKGVNNDVVLDKNLSSNILNSKPTVKKSTVYIHPSSVNFNALSKNKQQSESSGFDISGTIEKQRQELFNKFVIAYDIISRNDRSLASKTAWISPLLALLFAEKIDIHPSARIVTLNECLHTKCYPRTASVCQYMRNVLNQILKFRLYHPNEPVPKELQEWQDLILGIISNAA
ncbi:hypothetical protein H4219_002831 [Mycoemilia scoparia]|uniref:RNA helicase n=1 Tax=Mycoemilia scoparia TaxID=417184 RepID=A0A9W8DQ22_9FUNG|nr:hypothetical protein H4219_002831 [Mycoemilia scoparia]